jgi:glycine C-acetyltransferase
VGIVIDISLASVSILLDDNHTDLEGHTVLAKLMAGEKVFDLGDVYAVRAIKSQTSSEEELPMGEECEAENVQTQVIIKTLRGHIPIEHVMRYLDNKSGDSPYEFELAHGKFTMADFYAYEGSDDILEKANLFASMVDSWKKKNVFQFERYRKPSKGKRVILDRKRPSGSHDYLIFGSNDYLGFSSHPAVLEAAKSAIDSYGFGSTGSSVSTGLSWEHGKLCALLSEMFGKEDCLLYNSGYAANVGILSAICRNKDLVLYDQLCHASIQDGLKMATAGGTTCLPYKHNDMNHLEHLLQENRSSYRGCLIVTEGIFSMDGYIAKMDEIVALAERYNARTFLDVAHDFGVIGENGLGAAEYHNVLDRVDIIMGTFSKIAGGIGGFCVSTKPVRDYIRLMSRAYVFSVSLPPSTVCAAYTALKIFQEDKSRLHKLQDNIRYFVAQLRGLGIKIESDHKSTICPVVIGDEEKLDRMAKVLYDNGIFVTPIVYPAVSRNMCRFRFTVTTDHDRSDLDYAILVLKLALSEVGLLPNKADESADNVYRIKKPTGSDKEDKPVAKDANKKGSVA